MISFKPTWWNIGLTIILVVVFYFALGNVKIFQCTTVPLNNPLEFDDPSTPRLIYCGSGSQLAIINYTFLGELTRILVLIIVPYLLSCIVLGVLKRK